MTVVWTPDLFAMVILAAGLGTAFAYVVRVRPTGGVLAWLLVVALVPIWVSVQVGLTWPLVALVGILVVVSLASRTGRVGPLTLPDLLVWALFAFALGPFVVRRLSLSSAVGVVLVWIASFLLGRFSATRVGADRVYVLVAVIFTLVGALAVVELAFGWHGLAGWGPANRAHVFWGEIQLRGGVPRAEGAFGHSIALGCSLAMAAVLTLAARLPLSARLAMIAIQVAGAGATLSRTAVLCTAAGLVLAVLFLDTGVSTRVRAGAAATLTVAAVVVLPAFQDVLAVSAEAEGSAAYRGDLFSSLLPYVEWFGQSSIMRVSPDGVLFFGPFRSIDSQLMLFGLSYGWMTLGMALLLLCAGFVLVVRRRASPALVAVVAQAPALMTVALITQYAYLFWFVVGLAVAGQKRGRAFRQPTAAAQAGLPPAERSFSA